MFPPLLGYHQAPDINLEKKLNFYQVYNFKKGTTSNFNQFYSIYFNLRHNHTSQGACVYH